LNLPNYLTVFRIFLVPIFFIFLAYYDTAHPSFRIWALVIFVVAIVTDALDGALARQLKQQTELGTFLDPLADKLLLLSAFVGITFNATLLVKPPQWIVILIVFREVFLISGLVAVYLTTHRNVIAPNLLGKATTFFQMVTIVAILAQWSSSRFLWNTAATFTVISAAAYLRRGFRLINQN
jgi:CDP-diacylglycerol--glycerol-3-phosphate 3-phosphatidyltransferase